MAYQEIDVGTTANDGTGDQLRVAFQKTNSNFSELYAGGFTLSNTVPAASVGADGDVAGMVAYDGSYLYVCTADWDGSTDIWARVAIATW